MIMSSINVIKLRRKNIPDEILYLMSNEIL